MKNRKLKIGLFVCFVSLSLFFLLLGKYGHQTLIASNQDKPNTENTSETTENESLCEMSNSESTKFIDTVIEADISSPKKEIIEEEYPDIVLSLLGQGEQIADNDKRGTEAFFEHIIKKNS